jgi:single-stranded DNA-binding protein
VFGIVGVRVIVAAETVWESVDGKEKQNQNRREESLREQKKRKQGEGKQEQEQEQKAKKTGKAGGQASMESFMGRRG